MRLIPDSLPGGTRRTGNPSGRIRFRDYIMRCGEGVHQLNLFHGYDRMKSSIVFCLLFAAAAVVSPAECSHRKLLEDDDGDDVGLTNEVDAQVVAQVDGGDRNDLDAEGIVDVKNSIGGSTEGLENKIDLDIQQTADTDGNSLDAKVEVDLENDSKRADDASNEIAALVVQDVDEGDDNDASGDVKVRVENESRGGTGKADVDRTDSFVHAGVGQSVLGGSGNNDFDARLDVLLENEFGEYVNDIGNDIYADVIQKVLGGSGNDLDGRAEVEIGNRYRGGADRNSVFLDLGIGQAVDGGRNDVFGEADVKVSNSARNRDGKETKAVVTVSQSVEGSNNDSDARVKVEVTNRG